MKHILHRNRLKALLTLATFLSLPLSLLAQPGFDPGITDGAPIDGGLSLLAISGVVYGVNKYRASKKKASEAEENMNK